MNTTEKYQTYNTFLESSKSIFESFNNKTSETKRYDDLYFLNVVPKGRNGGIDNRVFEVFWGYRPFDSKIMLSGEGVHQKMLTEYGATLRYYQIDNGNVMVSLFPAHTEGLSPIEDRIEIDYIKNPKKLLDKKRLKKHWKYLVYYMRETAIEGYSNLISKFFIFYLRNFKYLSEKNSMKRPKAYDQAWNLLIFFVTVGLSGFVFYTVDYFKNKDKVDESIIELKAINNNLIEIEKRSKEYMPYINRSEEILNQIHCIDSLTRTLKLEIDNVISKKGNTSRHEIELKNR